jgi:DNA-directed RNA polymerase subunit RPC12/RpoP
MSEFKYACPVCGQHMMCDSSQSGSVMECPTCYQKIVAPQAPAADAKFILTGTKFTEKKIPATLAAAAAASGVAPKKSFPLALVIGFVLAAAAGAGIFAFRGKIFKSPAGGAPTNGVASSNGGEPAPPKAPKPEKPAVVAPPASDTNWTLALGTDAIPDSPVAGRIHGQNFIVERASFQNGSLMLRAGTHGAVEFGAFINFSGAQPEALSGKTINVTTNADKAARVSFRWKDASGTVQKENYDDSYALRLEFGTLANNRLPGKIYLCLPDAEKSYLLGAFNADARKPKPKAPKP